MILEIPDRACVRRGILSGVLADKVKEVDQVR